MVSMQWGAAFAGTVWGGYVAAPLSGRTAGFFMFVTLVSIVSWAIVIATTIARHGAKRAYQPKRTSPKATKKIGG